MFGKAIKVLLLLQIISIASAVSKKGSPSGVVRSSNSGKHVKKELSGHKIQKIKNFEHIKRDLNDDANENGQLNDEVPQKTEANARQSKLSSPNFKYSEDKKKDEAGFDLTSEEKKKFKIWKNGVIPYYIDVVSFSDKVLRDKIRNFLQMVNSATNVEFVELPGPPSNDHERWVLFLNRRGLLGCADHSVKNFTNQGVQQVVLGYDCIATRGEIAEAVMSILGVPAQHNAPDRDKYITVNMENIMPDKKQLFEKLSDNEWLFHELAYDFDSITHYDIHKYSANGRATVELKKSTEDLNPASTFSAIDLLKIKMLYNYITKSKNMKAPVCEKLFKLSKFSKPGSSADKPLNPRKKPSRYTGSAGPDVVEYNEKSEPSNGGKNEEQDNEETKTEDNVNAESIGKDDEKADKNIDANNENREQLKATMKSNLPKLDPLHLLSDYDSNEDTGKRIPLSYKLPKIDPLLAFSDYQTDEQKN